MTHAYLINCLHCKKTSRVEADTSSPLHCPYCGKKEATKKDLGQISQHNRNNSVEERKLYKSKLVTK